MNITKWKKSVCIGYILHESNIMENASQKGTAMEIVKWLVVAGRGEGNNELSEHRLFLVKILCMLL